MRACSWLLLVLIGVVVSTVAVRFSHADERVSSTHLISNARDDTTGDDLAVALGMYIRKFDVTLPDTASRVTVTLSNRAGDKNLTIGDSLRRDIKVGQRRSLMVSVQPIEGTISDADKLKFTVAGFGSVNSAVVDNPWKNQAMVFPSDAEVDGDGEFALIGVYHGQIRKGPIATADQVLRLKIETTAK